MRDLVNDPAVDYDSIKKQTNLSRSTVQRIAAGKTRSTSRLAELHRFVGLPPPERAIESRLADAFAVIAAAEPAHAEAIVVELERQAADLREAEREEGDASVARERAAKRRSAVVAKALPVRPVH